MGSHPVFRSSFWAGVFTECPWFLYAGAFQICLPLLLPNSECHLPHHIYIYMGLSIGSSFFLATLGALPSPGLCWPKLLILTTLCGFPGGSVSKVSACSTGDLGLIPVSGRTPGEGNGNPLQYSCLENPIPWTEVPGGLQFMGSQESDMTEWLNHHHHHSLQICWGSGSPGSLPLKLTP